MKSLSLSLTFLFFSAALFGQQEYEGPKHTISAQYGYGWFSLLNNTVTDIDVNDDNDETPSEYNARFSGSPASTIAYDYRVGRIFSIGGAIGHQKLFIDDFIDLNLNERLVGDVTLNRVFLSARTLFHYGKNPKWDLYSGVRTGLTVWKAKSTVDLEEFDFGTGKTSIGSAALVLPHLVPIPFGFKYYPTERLMIGSELAFGSPHFIALQVGVRL